MLAETAPALTEFENLLTSALLNTALPSKSSWLVRVEFGCQLPALIELYDDVFITEENAVVESAAVESAPVWALDRISRLNAPSMVDPERAAKSNLLLMAPVSAAVGIMGVNPASPSEGITGLNVSVVLTPANPASDNLKLAKLEIDSEGILGLRILSAL
jgi:hypothetical protein